MTAEPLDLPEACAAALLAVEADPLDPGPGAEAHLRTCPACSEARILCLSQEEVPDVLAPQGYFDRLPGRILRKLPTRLPLYRRVGPLAWSAAAAILLAVGTGAFVAGYANQTPYVEATLPHADFAEPAVADTPFRDGEEDAAQVQALSPEEMKALLQRLDPPPPVSPR
ncbi:hypothetical protein [Geothrix sp. 21YS21S-4]|uniref:hypothetical protein n=1 Tax=Geothrix sp. 21YS21S-4 TaxID=3068889 RepID=UPI0027BA28B2|nr:hypothetical protein [Geothrix sp. 21YS21S-4]